jgi:hypothetical protein
MCGALAGADPGSFGGAVAVTVGVAVGVGTRGSVPWAWIIAAETTSEAAMASHRPRPLANKFLPTDCTLVSCATRVAIFGS